MTLVYPPTSRILRATFTRDGALSDPNTVTAQYGRILPIGATTTSLTYGVDAALVRESLGVFSYEIDCTSYGIWVAKMTGTWTTGVGQPAYKTFEESWEVELSRL